jgi:hypothetical protein
MRTINLLKGSSVEDIIKGAYTAGESGNKKFVPLLLLNANDPRRCTNIHFKGMSVYYEKMVALKKIYKLSPPIPVKQFDTPDSSAIKFYLELYQRDKSVHANQY